MTLTDFLLARIAEDERGVVAFGGEYPTWARRLTDECVAKRRIMEAHPSIHGPRVLPVDSSGTDFGCETCHNIDPIHADGIIEAIGWCDTLRALAAVYAGHPDYRNEWRP